MGKVVVIFFLVICVVSCQRNEEQDSVIVLDMTASYEKVSVNLEDLASEIRLVRLETRENNLMRYFMGYVGDNYIISYDPVKILLFSAEGDFISVISNKGKGPGEFNFIDALDVDENEQYLYFHDQQKDYIYKYNLNLKSFGENIPLAERTNLMSDLVSLNDTTLAILPAKLSNNEYKCFFQSTTGNILQGLKKAKEKESRAWAGSTAFFRKSSENKVFLQPQDSDTLFVISGSSMKPFIAFHHNVPLQNGEYTEGTISSIIKINQNHLLFSKSPYKRKITPTSASYKLLDNEYLVHDITKNETKLIEKTHWNYHGIDLEVPYLSVQKGKRFGIQWSAYIFKETLLKAINEGKIDGKNLESIQTIYNQISSEDNPVLLTGKWK